MKRFRLLLLLFLTALPAAAQDDFIFDMPDDFAVLDTIQHPARFKSIHMIGASYGATWSGVTSSPGLGQEKKMTWHTVGVYYTYYHALWDQLFNFGLKFGAMHGYEGYLTPKNNYQETCEVVEFPLLSQFKLDFSRFRILLNIGPYAGYRLSTDKEGGFDKFDQRFDYGVIGGGGLGVVFNPFEIHLEANYKYAFASMYHTNKISDIYWIYTYPQNLMFSISLHFHLW